MGQSRRDSGEGALRLPQWPCPHAGARHRRKTGARGACERRRPLCTEAEIMLSVDEAAARIAASFACLPAESVSVDEAAGRVLAEDAVAGFDQPPAPLSAMDGYAVRA